MNSMCGQCREYELITVYDGCKPIFKTRRCALGWEPGTDCKLIKGDNHNGFKYMRCVW